jgi:hypothetical protein
VSASSFEADRKIKRLTGWFWPVVVVTGTRKIDQILPVRQMSSLSAIAVKAANQLDNVGT